MKKTILFVTAMLSGLTYADCTPDTENVSLSNSPIIRSFLPCDGCRSIQDFPRDFSAAVSNYIFHNDQGTSALGAYAGGNTNVPLTFPVCSEHGQCATATVTATFGWIQIPIPGTRGEFELSRTVLEHEIRTTDAGGNPDIRGSHAAGEPAPINIPTDTNPDTIPDNECRNNMGEERNGESSGDDEADENSTANAGGEQDSAGSNGTGGDSGGSAGTGGGSTGGGQCHTTMTENEIVLTCRRV